MTDTHRQNIMPKVKCYSAAWLAKNATGHQLFEPSPEAARSRALASPYASKKKPVVQGPRRTIARRGTEVFVAVGKEIRWGDLAYIKEEWTNNPARDRRGSSARVKREDSTVNLEDIPDFEAIGGLRVGIPGEDGTCTKANRFCRQSRSRSPTTFDSSSSHPTQISSPSSRRTPCTYVPFPTPRI